MKNKLVIFDLDGTLLNTLEDLTDCANYTLRNFGFEIKTSEQIKNAVGNGVDKLIERIIPEGKCNPHFEAFTSGFKQNYIRFMNNKTSPYPDVIQMLKLIKGKGLKIAVASNKFDEAVKSLCKKYFGDLADYSVGEDEKLGIRKKPNSDMLIKISENLNIPIKESCYVGDSEVDIQTAKNLKIPCISVTWGFKDEKFLKDNGAEYIINSPLEILGILDDL